MEKILITGATSKLAKFVIRELVDRYELVLTSRRPPASEFANLQWIEGDLTCFEDCQNMVRGVTAIQHLAAQPEPSDHPAMRAQMAARGIPFDATITTNLMGTYYLLQAAIEAAVTTVVMTGSNCAFGHGFRISQTPFPIQTLPIDESHPCYPEDSYSFSKRAAEDLLAAYSRAYGIRTYVTRPAAIKTDQLRQDIAATARAAEAWDPWLWGWVGAEDVASAQRLLLDRAADLPRHDVFVVNGDDTSALEPTRELVERFQPQLMPTIESSLSGHQAFFNCGKLKQKVDWQPKTSWRQYR